MTDLKSVGRQWKLEAEAARLGAERLRENTRRDETNAYSSGTVWGRHLVNAQIGQVAEFITTKKKRLTQGKAQQHGGIGLLDVINLIEPEVLAAIAAKRTLDLIGIGKDNQGRPKNTYTNVAAAIGAAVESEGRFNWYEHVASKEWKQVKAQYFKPTTGTRQKEILSRTLMKRRGYTWTSWSQAKRVQVGGFLLDAIAHTARWFTHKRRPLGKNPVGLHVVEMSEELKNLKGHLMATAELLAPLAWPMVCPPADWDPHTKKGGYLTNELRQGFSLIRGRRGTLTLGKDHQHWLDMLNTLQKVGYKVNPVTYKLAIQLESRQLDLDAFVMRENEIPIPRPDTENPDVLFQWRKDRTEQENRNAALKGKRYRALETLMIARRFIGEDVFYIPWSFDYRGRVYPLVSFMSPQGTGIEKSLYLFKDAQPINEHTHKWLARHLANTAGHDKLSMDEKVEWVEQNHELITIIAKDPLGSLALLESFDDPWGGVAACDEYYHCMILKDRQTTSLPIATDATCSGLQHLSAMTLDSATASLVNVKPGASPQDAYKAVLNRTLELLCDPTPELQEWHYGKSLKALESFYQQFMYWYLTRSRVPSALPNPGPARPDLAEWGAQVGRKLAKRVVMTVPYASTPHSNRGHIRDALIDYEQDREKQIQKDLNRFLSKEEKRRPSSSDLGIFTKTMLVAMEDVVPGPIRVMHWIKEKIGEYFTENPDGTVEWVTPSNFPVRQDKRYINLRRIQTHLLGASVDNRVGDGVKGVNKEKHRNCSAPNFIHSMDAALLHLSFAGYDKPFTLIHDSILTTASNMEEMAGVIREKFEEIYSKNDDGLIPLQAYAQVLGVKSAADHLINLENGLDISSVNDSLYFFC
mgnify:CR=1 FL=1